jgi:DNA polymerase-3 subunit beta
MRVTCEKSVLDNALTTVSRAISAKSPLPILSHVLLQAEPEGLTLVATDLNVGVRTQVAAPGAEAGALTCSASLLSEIVRRLPAGPVRLESVGEGSLKVSSGTAEFVVQTLPAEEFPNLPAGEDAPTLTLPQKTLKTMLSRVVVAAAEMDEARPVMMGVLCLLEPEALTMVATDGRRLARMTVALPKDPGRVGKMLVPARAMGELQRLLGDTDEPVQVQSGPGQAFFTVGTTTLNTRLLEGSYPDFRQVIPRSFLRTCRAGREQLAGALRRMLLVAQEKDSPHLVRMDFEPDRLILSAYTPDLGSGRDQVPVILEGEPLAIAFNGKLLLDVLGVLDTEEVQLDLQDECHSGVVRPLNDSDYDYVIMPVRLREPFPEAVLAGVGA